MKKLINSYDAIEAISQVRENAIVVSIMTPNRYFEKLSKNKDLDLPVFGAMGKASNIALGISIARPDKKIVCIDGDGSLIMHMGSLSTIGKVKPENFYHILMNNKVHESVGGQETSAKNINFSDLAKANGYKNTRSLIDKENFEIYLNDFFSNPGPSFIEINIDPGSRPGLGRPTINPIDSKIAFMKNIRKD